MVPLRCSSGGALPAKKPELDGVGAHQQDADKILRPESNRCSGTGSRRAGPLYLRCQQYFRNSPHVCQQNQGRDASGFHGQSTKSAGFPNISQPWSVQPVYASYCKIYERANSNSGSMSWSSAARRAAIYLVRVSLTSVRFSRPHVNGSWPSRTTTKSPIKRVVRPLPFGKRVNRDQPVMQADGNLVRRECSVFNPVTSVVKSHSEFDGDPQRFVTDVPLGSAKFAGPGPDVTEEALVKLPKECLREQVSSASAPGPDRARRNVRLFRRVRVSPKGDPGLEQTFAFFRLKRGCIHRLVKEIVQASSQRSRSRR